MDNWNYKIYLCHIRGSPIWEISLQPFNISQEFCSTWEDESVNNVVKESRTWDSVERSLDINLGAEWEYLMEVHSANTDLYKWNNEEEQEEEDEEEEKEEEKRRKNIK